MNTVENNKTVENRPVDVDYLVTLGVAEVLISPEISDHWVQEMAANEGVKLTEHQHDYLKSTIQVTLDQLAIPFIECLLEEKRERYKGLITSRQI